MPESIGQPSGGSGSGVSAVSPGSGASGFSSRALVFGAPDGSLTNNSSAPHWDSTNNFLGIGTTAPNAYLTVVSTGTGALARFAVGSLTGPNLRVFQDAGGNVELLASSNGDLAGTLYLNQAHNGPVVVAGGGGVAKLAAAGGSIAAFGAAGSTQPTTYTTAAITTARVFPSTASISTGPGVGGAPFGFTSRADMEALVRVVDSIYRDLTALGFLR